MTSDFGKLPDCGAVMLALRGMDEAHAIDVPGFAFFHQVAPGNRGGGGCFTIHGAQACAEMQELFLVGDMQLYRPDSADCASFVPNGVLQRQYRGARYRSIRSVKNAA